MFVIKLAEVDRVKLCLQQTSDSSPSLGDLSCTFKTKKMIAEAVCGAVSSGPITKGSPYECLQC